MNIKIFISTVLLSFSYIYSMELSSNPKGVYIVSCNESVTLDKKDNFENMGVHIVSYLEGTSYDYVARIKDANLLNKIKNLRIVRDIKNYNIEEHCDIKIDFSEIRDPSCIAVNTFEIQDRENLEKFLRDNKVEFISYDKTTFFVYLYENQNYLQIIDQLKVMPEVASIESDECGDWDNC